jgi:hypothetical protein
MRVGANLAVYLMRYRVSVRILCCRGRNWGKGQISISELEQSAIAENQVSALYVWRGQAMRRPSAAATAPSFFALVEEQSGPALPQSSMPYAPGVGLRNWS